MRMNNKDMHIEYVDENIRSVRKEMYTTGTYYSGKIDDINMKIDLLLDYLHLRVKSRDEYPEMELVETEKE
jgi:hypothetical protein